MEPIMSEIKCVTIIVHGRVQGVFFRESTKRKARDLGLAGTVRNQPDGTVQVTAQGPQAALDNLIRWAHDGPPASVVNDVRTSYIEPDPGLSGFEVTY